MKNIPSSKSGSLVLLLALATGLSLATFFYQGYGPFMGVKGNMCGPAEGGQLCIVPVLQGGWPLPYIFDNPTISVPDKLYTEDEINLGFFALDVCFYALIINLVRQLAAKDG